MCDIAWYSEVMVYVNPFPATACKISRLKSVQYMPVDSMFNGTIRNLLSILSILLEIFSHAYAKWVGGGWGGGGP